MRSASFGPISTVQQQYLKGENYNQSGYLAPLRTHSQPSSDNLVEYFILCSKFYICIFIFTIDIG